MEELLKEINAKLDAMVINNQEVFTVDEASKYLRISRSVLSREVQKGNIMFKANGSRYLFKRIWLDAWMER